MGEGKSKQQEKSKRIYTKVFHPTMQSGENKDKSKEKMKKGKDKENIKEEREKEKATPGN